MLELRSSQTRLTVPPNNMFELTSNLFQPMS